MTKTDMELLKAYRRGDVNALEALVGRHRSALYGYVFNMTRDTNEADEVFQEVWLRVIRKQTAYHGGNFGGWLMRIARNQVIDRARKRKPDVSLDAATDDNHALLERIPGDAPSPDRELEHRELGERIAAATAALPEEQREVFTLRTQAGLTFKEIARIQKTSINTALARMQYALAKLRPVLADRSG